MGVLHSFFIKDILYDKIDLRLFYCYVMMWKWLGRSLNIVLKIS